MSRSTRTSTRPASSAPVDAVPAPRFSKLLQGVVGKSSHPPLTDVSVGAYAVGAGLGGARAAETLREEGFESRRGSVYLRNLVDSDAIGERLADPTVPLEEAGRR